MQIFPNMYISNKIFSIIFSAVVLLTSCNGRNNENQTLIAENRCHAGQIMQEGDSCIIGSATFSVAKGAGVYIEGGVTLKGGLNFIYGGLSAERLSDGNWIILEARSN